MEAGPFHFLVSSGRAKGLLDGEKGDFLVIFRSTEGYHCHRHQLIDRCQNGKRRTTPSQEDQNKLAGSLFIDAISGPGQLILHARRLAKHMAVCTFQWDCERGARASYCDRPPGAMPRIAHSTGSSSMFGSPSPVPPALHAG